jgi:hypothetical protein
MRGAVRGGLCGAFWPAGTGTSVWVTA